MACSRRRRRRRDRVVGPREFHVEPDPATISGAAYGDSGDDRIVVNPLGVLGQASRERSRSTAGSGTIPLARACPAPATKRTSTATRSTPTATPATTISRPPSSSLFPTLGLTSPGTTTTTFLADRVTTATLFSSSAMSLSKSRTRVTTRSRLGTRTTRFQRMSRTFWSLTCRPIIRRTATLATN